MFAHKPSRSLCSHYPPPRAVVKEAMTESIPVVSAVLRLSPVAELNAAAEAATIKPARSTYSNDTAPFRLAPKRLQEDRAPSMADFPGSPK
jgi:hypothetical protein